MGNYTKDTTAWKMSQVVSYLMKYYFGNKPTSNEELSDAFWKVMGKDIFANKQRRWTSGRYGVPYQIHQKVEFGILQLASLQSYPPPEHHTDVQYPEYRYMYVLGEKGEKHIHGLLSTYSKDVIDAEISKYLGSPSAFSISDKTSNLDCSWI